MLAFLPAPLLFIINISLISLVTVILSIPVFVGALIRLILPVKPLLHLLDQMNQQIYHLWVGNNQMLLKLTNRIKWDIQGLNEAPSVKGSCIIISNHVSWTDIVMLGCIYGKKIPLTKFFLKQSLIYIPILGQVCYSLGMPFLRRYSRTEILKNPKLMTRDINATRKACNILLEHPSTLVNFVEGTRYTPQKAREQKSPHHHLMPPKAASLAIALGIIGKDIECLFNTTLLYPENSGKGNVFIAMLSGRLTRVIARIEVIKPEQIKEELIGDYLNDKQFKRQFTVFLRNLWQEKDRMIGQLLHDPAKPSAPAATALDTAAQDAAAPDTAAAAAAGEAAFESSPEEKAPAVLEPELQDKEIYKVKQ